MLPQHWSIRTKLVSSFGALLVLLIGLGLFALSQLRTVNATAADMRDIRMPSVQTLGDIKYAITRYRLFGARQSMTSDVTQTAQLVRTTQALVGQLTSLQQTYDKLISSAEERRLYEAFLRDWAAYDAIHKPMLEQAKRGDLTGAATAFNVASLAPFNGALASLDQLIKLNRDGAQASGQQAQAAYDGAFTMISVGIGAGIAFALLAAFWIIASVSVPVVRMTGTMRQVAGGELDVAVPGAGRRDEIGAMAAAVEVFRQNALSVRRMEAEADEAARRVTAEKRAAMAAMADRFEAEVMGVARAVAAAAEQLQANARSMNGVAEGTNRQSQSVASASQETSANVQTVAAAAEELSASVAEIGGQVTLAASAAGQASGEAQGAGSRVFELATSVGRIGQVVDLIRSIAEQTNLLALNATIEAARAGDAGKGFAVVASEVKTLATQTAKATEEIGGQISGVQGATDEVVRAIEAVAARIGQVNEISTAISAAVQEQGAAVAEIARNVQQAAQGTEDVTQAISGVSRAAEETGQVASEMVQASSDLARQAEVLTAQIGAFMQRVRAA